MTDTGAPPLLRAINVTKRYGGVVGCCGASFEAWPGEVLGIVGESGSGKTTLLNCASGNLEPGGGRVEFLTRDGETVDLYRISETARRSLMRSDWGFIHQNPLCGLRTGISAGGNIGERLMAVGERHYGRIRDTVSDWLQRVEFDTGRIDDLPAAFSGGMQRRVQIARNLVNGPRLVFMDEPTSGLDVSVQARLLDLLRKLVSELELCAIVVTHDLAVARLLSHRLLVMKDGRIVESGLTDRVLDDPQHPYSQLLVSSVVQV